MTRRAFVATLVQALVLGVATQAQARSTCVWCAGTGVCQECGGTGGWPKACSHCSGSGKCNACQGKGYVS